MLFWTEKELRYLTMVGTIRDRRLPRRIAPHGRACVAIHLLRRFSQRGIIERNDTISREERPRPAEFLGAANDGGFDKSTHLNLLIDQSRCSVIPRRAFTKCVFIVSEANVLNIQVTHGLRKHVRRHTGRFALGNGPSIRRPTYQRYHQYGFRAITWTDSGRSIRETCRCQLYQFGAEQVNRTYANGVQYGGDEKAIRAEMDQVWRMMRGKEGDEMRTRMGELREIVRGSWESGLALEGLQALGKLITQP